VYGNGEQPVFLTYVDDVVRNIALYTLDQKYDATIRDTGNSIQMSVNEMAEMIRRLTKSKAGIRTYPCEQGKTSARSSSRCRARRQQISWTWQQQQADRKWDERHG